MTSGKDRGDQPRAKREPGEEAVKVLICDASSVVRGGLGQMLRSDSEILVVAECSSGEHVAAVAKEAGIDVVVGDPHQLGTDAIKGLIGDGVNVLIVSFSVDEQHLMHAILSGCSGYVDQREIKPGDLSRLVRLAANGHTSFSDHAYGLLRRYLRQNAVVLNGNGLEDVPVGQKLSLRERQVLRHLARGRTNKAIAELLNVSESTVKTHVLHIYDKLDVRSRLDLISLAIERGWIQDAHHAVESRPSLSKSVNASGRRSK